MYLFKSFISSCLDSWPVYVIISYYTEIRQKVTGLTDLIAYFDHSPYDNRPKTLFLDDLVEPEILQILGPHMPAMKKWKVIITCQVKLPSLFPSLPPLPSSAPPCLHLSLRFSAPPFLLSSLPLLLPAFIPPSVSLLLLPLLPSPSPPFSGQSR